MSYIVRNFSAFSRLLLLLVSKIYCMCNGYNGNVICDSTMGNKKLQTVQWPHHHILIITETLMTYLCVSYYYNPQPLYSTQELNVQKGKFIIKLNMIFKEVNCQWTTIFFALASKLLALPAWSLELLMVSLIWINYFWSWSRQLVCQLIFFPCGRAGDSCESLEHHWEVISLLGNDFVNFVCLPLLLPIHSMATQAKIFMMGKNRDFTPRSLFKAKQSTGTAQAQAKQHLNRERYEKPQGCVRIQPLLFTRKIFVAWIAEGGRYFMGENSKNFLRWRSQIYRELRSHQKESKQYYSCKNRTRHRPVVEVIVGLFLSKCLMCVVVWTVKWWNTFQRSPWKKCVQ